MTDEKELKFEWDHRKDVTNHCYRGQDLTIRIISARKATKNEVGLYGEQLE